MLRLLLTNDDGIDAPGVQALARQFGRRARVCIVAPNNPRSACSHTITLHKPLRLRQRPDICLATGAVEAYECSGMPADCVTLALQHLYRDEPPDFVLSGINDGPNLGEDLIYSGTVAGAVEGAIHSVPAMAVSLSDVRQASFAEAAELVELLLCTLLFGGCSAVQAELASRLSRGAQAGDWTIAPSGRLNPEAPEHLPSPGHWVPPGLRRTPCFNVNIPDLALADLAGIRWTGLGHREYRNVVVEQTDPRGKPLYWIWGDRIIPPQQPDSDILAVSQGFAAITPIRGDLLNRSDLAAYSALFQATESHPAKS